MLLLPLLAVLTLRAAAAQTPTLIDPPLAADSVTYLDGTWTATGAAGASGTATGHCTYAPNTDWRPPNGGGSGRPVRAASPEACCQACIAASGCVVAALARTDCWLKTAEDAAGGSVTKPNVTSCNVTRSTPGQSRTKYVIAGMVPGDIITDLQNSGLVGDPYHEINFRNVTLWHNLSWTYSTTFNVTADQLAGGEHVLVFDGVKMGASVKLNGHAIGTITDQFLRYRFPVTSAMLTAGGINTLNVSFGDRSIQTDGRWMPCSRGWDWAPVSRTGTFSYGIWKSVYIAQVSTAALVHVVPQIKYKGEYPVAPLTDSTHGGFDVSVRVHIWAPKATTGTLSITTSWSTTPVTAKVSIAAGNSSTIIKLPSATAINLWWPAGHGAQPLYNLSVAFIPAGSFEDEIAAAVSVSTQRRVGFRVFALVTGNDTDADWVAANKDGDGSAAHGMYWRINGAAILVKGSSMVPMEELEGRMSADAHHQLVVSAAVGQLNTLRVWGGGMFLPRAFYDAADELGILLYHDMMYAQGASPRNTSTQDAEIRHQIRRLSAHPSIVIWDGCNECGGGGLISSFVLPIVAEEDPSRAIMPSCPSYGWASGVNTLTGRPNGKPLVPVDPSCHSKQHSGCAKGIESHGPYRGGSGFSAINGNAALGIFPSQIPLSIQGKPTGLNYSNVSTQYIQRHRCQYYLRLS
jgi:hypothetical protein